jgi:hypothetical protein
MFAPAMLDDETRPVIIGSHRPRSAVVGPGITVN